MRSIGWLLAMTALVAGCGSGDEPSGTAAVTQNNNSFGTSPPTAQVATELSPTWLAGRWQAGGGSCGAGDTFFVLEAGGRYAFAEEEGRWTLDGDRLTIEVTRASSDSGTEAGQRSTIVVRRLGADEAEFTPDSRTPVRVARCPNP